MILQTYCLYALQALPLDGMDLCYRSINSAVISDFVIISTYHRVGNAMSDQERTQALYHYLILCFANSRHSRSRDGKLKERAVGRRLVGLRATDENPRDQALAEKGRTLMKKLREGKPMTVSQVVDCIAGLQAGGDESAGEILTPKEVLIALFKLVSLTPAERQRLGLPSGEAGVLLQQVLLNIWLDQKTQDYSKILKLYRTSIGLEKTLEDVRRPQDNLRNHVNQVIESTASQALEYISNGEHYPTLRQDLTDKTKREVQRILLKGGSGQLQFESPDGEDYIRAYLPDAYVERLTTAVIENELLTRLFPVYIKTITIQECSPLPLPICDQSFSKLGLFYAPLLKADRNGSLTQASQFQGEELASQYAHRVTVHFYLRLPSSYKAPAAVQDIFNRLAVDNVLGQRIDFSVSSVGIGGTLSHIIKTINYTLLSNIPSLINYFPIAHDIVVHQEIIRNNIPSPVWAHTLVQLCRTDILAQAMSASSVASELKPYEQFAFDDCIGHGDYCGFDMILCQAIAALQARLRAIRYAGVVPEAYLQDLTDRTLKQRCLQAAKSYVTSYPFSSFAQESYLRETLLHDLEETPLTLSDSYIRFEACLTIAETYLEEGMYRRAHIYLEAVGTALKPLSEDCLDWYERFLDDNNQTEIDFRIFSGTLLVHFELCRALYFYLVDREAELGNQQYLPQYIPRDQNKTTFHLSLIESAWQALDRAEKHLTIRLAKYFLIHEVSQGTFHPHYQFLAKIYFLRARILTFFPEVPYETNPHSYRLPTDERSRGQRSEREIYAGRLHLLEKARLYAASDGDTERYSCYTAYQSWSYWIAHFAPSHHRLNFLPEDCQRWSQRLLDHALLSYTEIGRQCYYQIKEKSGVEEPSLPNLRKYEIGRIPAIIETRRSLNVEQQEDGEVLYLDMTFLALRKSWLRFKDGSETDELIYLFGPKASYLLFARGMYQLCSSEKEEFSEELPTTIPDWDQKFSIAYRLFTYAWAMADAGGTIEMVRTDLESDPTSSTNHRLSIRRNFTLTDANGRNRDAASVRDLYPHQVSEMTDLGQVFAAACACLRLYIVPVDQRGSILDDIDWLLGNLQKENYCSQRDVAFQVREQPRYSGHLTSYLERCKQILKQTQQEILTRRVPVRDVNLLEQERKSLLLSLFNSLHEVQ